MNIFFIMLLTLGTNCLCLTQKATLNNLASKYGTDKGPEGHNYTKTYEKYFHTHKDKPLKILEIGFLVGLSARMWDSYFTHPETKIYFIDIIPECYKYTQGLSNRCSLHLADQGSKDSLLEFVSTVGGNFDIIIDDGGHTMNQQIISFQTLFPFLKKEGIYVVEDLHTSYWKQFGGAGTQAHPKTTELSAIRFLQSLVDDLNYSGATSGYGNKNRCSQELARSFNSYQRDIDAIHFYTSLCFILKN